MFSPIPGVSVVCVLYSDTGQRFSHIVALLHLVVQELPARSHLLLIAFCFRLLVEQVVNLPIPVVVVPCLPRNGCSIICDSFIEYGRFLVSTSPGFTLSLNGPTAAGDRVERRRAFRSRRLSSHSMEYCMLLLLMRGKTKALLSLLAFLRFTSSSPAFSGFSSFT